MKDWRKDYCIKLGNHIKQLIEERNLDPQTVASMANIESKQCIVLSKLRTNLK